MRGNSIGLKRSLAGRRLLSCEQLENRALLTSLIASAEIAPGPIAEFTTQAKSFVEAALERVMTTQHQTPISTSSDRLTGVSDDGRPVRITNVTVELDARSEPMSSRYVPESLVTTASNARPALPSTSDVSLRSNLIFSFMIYADNSVTIRAKLNNPPQWLGFASASGSLTENLRLRFNSNEHANGFMAIASYSTTQLGDRTDGSEVVVSTATRVSGGDEPTSATGLAYNEIDRSGDDGHESNRGTFDSLADQLIAIEYGDGDSIEGDQSASRHAQCLKDIKSGASTLPTVVAELQASEHTGLPIPRGMVHLEYSQTAAGHNSDRLANPHASAIYQVFVQASDHGTLSGIDIETLSLMAGHSSLDAARPRLGLNALESQPSAAEEAAGVDFNLTDEIAPGRWQSTTLAVASLAGGLVLAIRPKRGQQPIHPPGTTGVPA